MTIEHLSKEVMENARKIESMYSKVESHDITIVAMQKDYEYMKKAIDNIEYDSKENHKSLMKKLESVEQQMQNAEKQRLKAYDEMKNHSVKAVLTGIIGAVVGGLITFFFR